MNLMRAAFRASQPSLSRVQALFQPSDTAALFDPTASALYANAAGTTPAVTGGPVGLRLDVARGVMQLGPELTDITPTVGVQSAWNATTKELILRRVSGTDGDVVFPNALTSGRLYLVTQSSVSAVDGATLGYPQYILTTTSTVLAAGVSVSGAPLFFLIANGSGNLLLRHNASGNGCKITGLSIREVLGNHASQGTTALCPILRVTPNSGQEWLEAPDSDDALNLTFASAPGECDVGVLNGDGSFTWTRPTLGTTVNVVTRFALNAFWVMRKRGFEPPERALIERYAKRYAPAPGEWT